MTSTRYEVDAVLDRSGVIARSVDIGSDATVSLARDSEPDETVRRAGYIVAGFHDAHLHLGSISAATTGISLDGALSLDEIARLLTSRGTGDVVAIGFDEADLAEHRLLTISDLDAMVDDRAVVVYRRCGHIAMANSLALDRARIDSATPDPADGSIDRDNRGRPTGVLRETAIDLVTAVISDDQRDVGPGDLLASAHRLAALGLDSVTAMVPAGAPAWCGPDDEFEQLLLVQDSLPIRVDAVLIAEETAELERHAERCVGPNLTFAGWKGFADGSLGGHTAALTSPYADTPGQTGKVRLDARGFRLLSEKALELGGSSCIHAIGDAAVAQVLDIFDDLIATGASPNKLRVEHASVLSRSLIERMAESGVLASVQPQFVDSDAHLIESRVGPIRAPWVYPFRSMLDAGVQLLGGSDAPVERPDPLAAVRAAVDRTSFNPDQALEPTEALSLFSDRLMTNAATWVSPDLRQFERLL